VVEKIKSGAFTTDGTEITEKLANVLRGLCALCGGDWVV